MISNKSNLPNFLIVGVAKCGTTSLVKYLDENPKIFISKNKEPRYLTYDILSEQGYKGPGDFRPKKIAVKTAESYRQLFKEAEEFIAIGEASTDTIYYYEHTINRIKDEFGDPRIVIMLRDPVKRAISAYSHLIREERETLSFEDGLLKEEERLNNGYECIWGYVKGGLYYEPVKAFKEAFSEVKILIFEDFVKNSKESVNEVLSFLKVEHAHDFSMDRFNKSGRPKNKLINKFLTRKSWLKSILKKILGEKLALKAKGKVQESNLQKIQIDRRVQNKLYLNFKKDIEQLEKYLGINLEQWKY
ncbi:sulfotransferase family protein [Winogradskyella vincentii]|uniref:Sulfotransferase n=1 Tax=Winogradskyella vincentii TaxID=2877122 RepID=A0ABS7XXJ6_9FLAO|nr:sulfotransferase [Winogradskyella vincentii]MCA0152371.1 sulfotransferase [Winogradskyella vincentii]